MSLSRLFPLNCRITGRRITGHILLVLVVLVSSLAWLPPVAQAAPQAASHEETSAKPILEAWIVGSNVYIEASKLPRNHTFNLRARRNSYDSWTKLTRAQSNRNGILVKSARLPSYLARAERLHVCLKDTKNGRVYCTRARREY